MVESEKTKCYYCAEEILSEARKCRYCGEWVKFKENATNIGSTNFTPPKIINNKTNENFKKLTKDQLKNIKQENNFTQALEAKGEGISFGLILGIGSAPFYIFFGVLLSLTGIGAIIGIPLIIVGFFAPIIGPLIGSLNIKGLCPYCNANISVLSTELGTNCRACKKRVLIKDKKFFKVE